MNPSFDRAGANFNALGTSVVSLRAAASIYVHQLLLRGSGAVSATVRISGTTDPTGQLGRTEIAVLTASGTNTAADAVPPLTHSWPVLVYECTAISGAGAVADVVTVGA